MKQNLLSLPCSKVAIWECL